MGAPFILKMAFYMPGDEAKNVCHILYIGTRPGADRGEGDVEIGDRESYFYYKKFIKFDEAAGHVKYAAERPRSHGLFGPDEGKIPDLEAVQNELWHHKGIVWRAVLSLREDDAVRMGYVERKAWEDALRASVPEAASKMGISESNLRWVAAFHAEPGHPHCHLVIWEAEPERKRGMLSLGKSMGELRDVRKVFVRQIFAGERARLGAEKTALRDLIRDLGKSNIRELLSEVKSAREDVRALDGAAAGVPPRLHDEVRAALGEKLAQIADILPGKGRVALKFMPPEVKEKVREAADWMMKQPGFSDSVQRYVEIAREMAGHYSMIDDKLEEAGRKAYEDLRDRVGQEILKGAVELGRVAERDGASVPDEVIIEGDEGPLVVDSPGGGSGEVSGTLSSGARVSGGNIKNLPDKLFKDAWRVVDRAVFRLDPGVVRAKLPKIEIDFKERIRGRLEVIAGLIQEEALKGRLALAYLPGEVKKEARDLAGLLIWSEKMKPFTEKYLASVRDVYGEEAADKALFVLRERVAEQVVNRAAELLPREIPQVEMFAHNGRVAAAKDRLKNATAGYIRGNVIEAEWMAGTMYRALVKLGVARPEARERAINWGREAGVTDAERVVSKAEEKMAEIAVACEEKGLPEPVHVSRRDWTRLRENLGLEEEECLYPWFGVLKQNLQERDTSDLPEGQKNIQHELVESRVSPAVRALEAASGRPENYAEVYWTVRTFAGALQALGIGEAGRERVVRGWIERAGVGISEARLKDVLDRVTVLPRKDFWLGRASWRRLTENLGIQDPPASPWRVLVDRSGNVAGQVWKAVWKAVERERTRLEAQRLTFKRMEDMRRKKAKEREDRFGSR